MIHYIVAIAVSFIVVYGTMPALISYLRRHGMSVPDMNKSGHPPIPRPGGPAIALGICSGMIILFWYTGDTGILAMIITICGALCIGYADDKHVMPGWFKPLGLAAVSAPVIFLGTYDTRLVFPAFDAVSIPILYMGVIIAIISITGNTINSIDVMNGVASGYICIATAAICVVLAVLQRWDALVFGAILLTASCAFYRYHRLPSRIFPGDSGALVLGVTYGCVTIYGGVEVVAAVAILPCIMNSFLFLHSVRRIVEHRQIKYRSVIQDDNMMLRDSGDERAPVTLVRLILSGGPKNEAGVVAAIFRLGYLSAALAIFTGILMVLP